MSKWIKQYPNCRKRKETDGGGVTPPPQQKKVQLAPLEGMNMRVFCYDDKIVTLGDTVNDVVFSRNESDAQDLVTQGLSFGDIKQYAGIINKASLIKYADGTIITWEDLLVYSNVPDDALFEFVQQPVFIRA